MSTHTVDIPPTIKKRIEKFRFARVKPGVVTAISFKISKDLVVEEDEYWDDVSLDELGDELPSMPRYIIVSLELKRKDGRTFTPLLLLNWCPTTSSPTLTTLYASAFSYFQITADVAKVLEVRDASDLSQESVEKFLQA